MKNPKFAPPAIFPSCGGRTEKGETTFTVDFGSGVVVIRNVPATICSQCGME
ncbi:type II toxin-antitoxin system MqsA family antitoxin [Rhodohalobacter sp. 8-1]|uniref:type II toxin-antitoxin system MqsA family antitoxin n=1 Tax=Rhodohalobacter sp. 8-1 TaxID=3131972 RepID=UPI0030EBCCAB